MKPILGLAPMDGFTDAACRSIAQDIRDTYGEKERYNFHLWTEFMTADGFVRNPDGVKHHLETTPNQTQLIVQIFGGSLDTLLQTVINLQKEYAERFIGIELNMGCPANNVMKSGGGAELLRCKSDTLEIIKSLRKAIHIPFSIKTRAGLNEQDKENQTAFLLQASAFVDMITIHGRTVAQGYGPSPDRDFIYHLKDQLPNQTIIGNGGITSYQEIPDYVNNLDGVMIGQAAIGNPRIFTPHSPTNEEKYTTIIKHLDLLPKTEKAMIEFRKHLFSYVKGITGSKEFKVACSQYKDYQAIKDHIHNFFDSIQE